MRVRSPSLGLLGAVRERAGLESRGLGSSRQRILPSAVFTSLRAKKWVRSPTRRDVSRQ